MSGREANRRVCGFTAKTFRRRAIFHKAILSDFHDGENDGVKYGVLGLSFVEIMNNEILFSNFYSFEDCEL